MTITAFFPPTSGWAASQWKEEIKAQVKSFKEALESFEDDVRQQVEDSVNAALLTFMSTGVLEPLYIDRLDLKLNLIHVECQDTFMFYR